MRRTLKSDRLLGLPIPVDLDASVPEAVFETAYLTAHPPILGEPTCPPHSYFDAEDATLDPRGEAQIMQRLFELGYIRH